MFHTPGLLASQGMATHSHITVTVRCAGRRLNQRCGTKYVGCRPTGAYTALHSALPSPFGAQQVDVRWRVGLALQSSVCADLNEPFVTLVFQVASDGLATRFQAVELSVAQFQDVAEQFKEMARLLELSA